ncbi:hypothetical protein M2145_001320 [Lachnospiraceae bacterium PF1-21]|uniref:DUF1129 domain-containing protein n=1 Tax=Ohessyouella blattaphilus TaxID=2949333 RepID=A0ABT1EK22_9FIRM|nr:hypothetical protein [Ohessyouella blattaphilus]MCP1111054.1 hypothetical protein [Ohessyouella blattaphilus]MCR8564448.1 hypothetical protein [Ohessyouella blattaphilus]
MKRKEFEQIKDENNRYLIKLLPEDATAITDVLEYLRGELVITKDEVELIKKDLIQISLDAEARSETFLKAIGNKQEFADSIRESYRRKSLFNKITDLIFIFSLYLFFSMVLQYSDNEGYVIFSMVSLISSIFFFLTVTLFELKLDSYFKVVLNWTHKQLFALKVGLTLVFLILTRLLMPLSSTTTVNLPFLPALITIGVILLISFSLKNMQKS